MRELARTGFMSNRGRQNVASFLTKVRRTRRAPIASVALTGAFFLNSTGSLTRHFGIILYHFPPTTTGHAHGLASWRRVV